MLAHPTISIGFLSLGFSFQFLGTFFNLPLASYLAAMSVLVSLYLFKKITPLLFIFVLSVSFLFFLLSPSPYVLASLVPLIGILFSGANKHSVHDRLISRYFFVVTFYCFYLIYYLAGFTYLEGSASHNQLSVLLVYALIAELLYFGTLSRLYIPLIVISFLLFGNRSAVFLLAVFIRSKTILLIFLGIGAIFVLFTYEILSPPGELKRLFEIGGILYRSSVDARGDYLDEFVHSFNLLDLRYDKWKFFDTPKTVDGAYDLHNSILTIVVRDSYLGLFKVFLWLFQIWFLPLGVFSGITLRAFYDTFLLGGINDILVFALVGRSIKTVLRNRRGSDG